ncbi:unnamed protein product [Chrysodeixis includens]|uniref:Uncharacterized protein n=1 Tax=Chrysodeixis includens TaxID=689277 RepID=A0A9P0BZF9_CHRIL|nr:unnamed protein product [Chrysodeixis includens]
MYNVLTITVKWGSLETYLDINFPFILIIPQIGLISLRIQKHLCPCIAFLFGLLILSFYFYHTKKIPIFGEIYFNIGLFSGRHFDLASYIFGHSFIPTNPKVYQISSFHCINVIEESNYFYRILL